MPPKAKFTREEIVDSAFSMVRESGMESLTARELSKRLGSSARPIFTVFNSMDEVKEAVVQRAVGLALEYIRRGLKSEIPSKGVGMSYIQFAMDEPQLFRLLFMMPSKESRTVLSIIEQFNGLFQMSDLIVGSYGIDKEQATRVFQNIWIYTHGIATMIVNRLCSYTEEEISDRLTEVFWALIEREKAGHRGRSCPLGLSFL
jgi:AcrR family transcriptional regulator